MEKFFIRYHIVGNRVVSETKEFENFGEAVALVGTAIRNLGWIGIVRDQGHVVEIKTESITYFEVLNQKSAESESAINHLSNLVNNAFREGAV
ncbi:hypothetical protein [Bacillus benzoevorans]|uniref:Uncharacterized protein n=1 Tax=Bacillus benzoevorans TaxID=1456 RepID=A0A7X0HVN9_9BACI|nr:hypothetical protein [Bacillus benzoevorans]MBB6446480.1 hypothetical protein [Bacillus benzoevorans]